MRAVTDNTGVTAGTTLAMLNGMKPFARADLLTFQLTSGLVLRYAAWDWPVTFNGNVYSNTGPQFRRDTVKHKVGTEVDEMSLQILALDGQYVQGTQGWATAAREGVFDGALFSLDLALFAGPLANTGAAPSPTGFVNWFNGYVDAMTSIDPPILEFAIKSDLGRLTIKMPRNYYQLTCGNTLFDRGCGLARAGYAVTGTVTAVNADGSFTATLSATLTADNWFQNGSLYWTGGNNAGLARGIKNSIALGTRMAIYQPMPQVISIGDTFTAYPGCDKTQTTCAAKFSNFIHFRGTPFVPQPEVTM